MLNRGVAAWLSGDTAAAAALLRDALRLAADPAEGCDPTDAICTLVLGEDGTYAAGHDALPIDAAILLNLWRMKELAPSKLADEVRRLYPDREAEILRTFDVEA